MDYILLIAILYGLLYGVAFDWLLRIPNSLTKRRYAPSLKRDGPIPTQEYRMVQLGGVLLGFILALLPSAAWAFFSHELGGAFSPIVWALVPFFLGALARRGWLKLAKRE